LVGLNLADNALRTPAYRPRERVHVVGYPNGQAKPAFSMSGNEVVDHELVDATPPRGHRRIHYQAGTEPGMSGSPVIDARTCKIVGLHHKGNVRPFRPAQPPEYDRANEAIWVKSVCDALTRR
jgi:V8-like Glu-specific endopeptidase